jgi:hypothetical protein
MSLAITAGSLPTLRPLYRVVANKFKWNVSFFSNSKSYKSMEGGSERKRSVEGIVINDKSDVTNYSKYKGSIVNVKSEEFVLMELRPATKSGHMGITRVTNVQVEFEDEYKL